MIENINLDESKWGFLEHPKEYARGIEGKEAGLIVEPLERQFKTVKEILKRFQGQGKRQGHGVLLADDVGLGKTTVGALVAWIFALHDMRVRIYAPNEGLQRRWAEEMERHVPLLSKYGASHDRIKPGHVGKLHQGRIQITTHFQLVQSCENQEQRTACDLMIIDEAHRAKGDGSAFKDALCKLGHKAKRKLILTATPFSIRLAELQQLLNFVGAPTLAAVESYAARMQQLYSLDRDAQAESVHLVSAAKAAIDQLRKYVIRHSIDDLCEEEQKHFGSVDENPWDIAVASASEDDVKLLLRMDRMLQIARARKGERRNDPRFHIGWDHMKSELNRLADNGGKNADHVLDRHIKAAAKDLAFRRKKPHPKISAVIDAVRTVVDSGEKVLIFCHHRATARELLTGLEQTLEWNRPVPDALNEEIWESAWRSVLSAEEIWSSHSSRPTSHAELMEPIVRWLCTPGLRSQIAGWIGRPSTNSAGLAKQLLSTKARNDSKRVATIAEAARMLVKTLLDEQSKSTRAVLRNMGKGQDFFGKAASHFPGRLDEGFRVMGCWDDEAHGKMKTLYTGKSDMVIALFNSPFGPDVLVVTDRLSEGVDLHRCCRHLIHYELDPSPVRTLQRNGRIRRVGSWAALTGRPICYAYPYFSGTRDEKAVGIMRQRINAFGLLLGGVPSLDGELDDASTGFAELVLSKARTKLSGFNRELNAGAWNR